MVSTMGFTSMLTMDIPVILNQCVMVPDRTVKYSEMGLDNQSANGG